MSVGSRTENQQLRLLGGPHAAIAWMRLMALGVPDAAAVAKGSPSPRESFRRVENFLREHRLRMSSRPFRVQGDQGLPGVFSAETASGGPGSVSSGVSSMRGRVQPERKQTAIPKHVHRMGGVLPEQPRLGGHSRACHADPILSDTVISRRRSGRVNPHSEPSGMTPGDR